MSDHPGDPDESGDRPPVEDTDRLPVEDANRPPAEDADHPVASAGRADPDEVDDLPRVSCERCGREWTLEYELDELAVGNQAIAQFALDHQRHTGHFPDGVATHRAVCRRCPESVQRLSAEAARRWAEVHARHTRHSVELRRAGSDDEDTLIGQPEGE